MTLLSKSWPTSAGAKPNIYYASTYFLAKSLTEVTDAKTDIINCTLLPFEFFLGERLPQFSEKEIELRTDGFCDQISSFGLDVSAIKSDPLFKDFITSPYAQALVSAEPGDWLEGPYDLATQIFSYEALAELPKYRASRSLLKPVTTSFNQGECWDRLSNLTSVIPPKESLEFNLLLNTAALNWYFIPNIAEQPALIQYQHNALRDWFAITNCGELGGSERDVDVYVAFLDVAGFMSGLPAVNRTSDILSGGLKHERALSIEEVGEALRDAHITNCEVQSRTYDVLTGLDTSEIDSETYRQVISHTINLNGSGPKSIWDRNVSGHLLFEGHPQLHVVKALETVMDESKSVLDPEVLRKAQNIKKSYQLLCAPT